ncbi:hypothetical protein T440DRAFT_173629 [Plenodomus tracheiphilus IPT5]|uniref:Uncharacterized protein n=1 Tax=Plenodomus tracheiphilus IPT5 TaxID=1408161 RepID=A0A6A7B1K3_9PLEO|nr:hypothetical protein T440DRAFT_173629 [Plenodomus tracheiphilus IPT5]
MRSFAVIAGFAAAANAYAYGSYEAKNATSSVAAHETPANGYPVASSSAGYPASSAPAYTTTKIVTGLTTVCPEPTTVTYGTKTYTVSTSTTLIDEECEYSTVVTIKPTPSAAHPTSVATPANTHYAPPVYSQAPPAAPYPSAGNGTLVSGSLWSNLIV